MRTMWDITYTVWLGGHLLSNRITQNSKKDEDEVGGVVM